MPTKDSRASSSSGCSAVCSEHVQWPLFAGIITTGRTFLQSKTYCHSLSNSSEPKVFVVSVQIKAQSVTACEVFIVDHAPVLKTSHVRLSKVRPHFSTSPPSCAALLYAGDAIRHGGSSRVRLRLTIGTSGFSATHKCAWLGWLGESYATFKQWHCIIGPRAVTCYGVILCSSEEMLGVIFGVLCVWVLGPWYFTRLHTGSQYGMAVCPRSQNSMLLLIIHSTLCIE